MKVGQFKKLIKEAVAEAIQEEFAVMRGGKQPVQESLMMTTNDVADPNDMNRTLMSQLGLDGSGGEAESSPFMVKQTPKPAAVTPVAPAAMKDEVLGIKHNSNLLMSAIANTAKGMNSSDLAAVGGSKVDM